MLANEKLDRYKSWCDYIYGKVKKMTQNNGYQPEDIGGIASNPPRAGSGAVITGMYMTDDGIWVFTPQSISTLSPVHIYDLMIAELNSEVHK